MDNNDTIVDQDIDVDVEDTMIEEEEIIIEEVKDTVEEQEGVSEDVDTKESVITPTDKPQGVQGRINDLTKKRRDAEREVEYWKKQALKGSKPKDDINEAKPVHKANVLEKPTRYLYDDEDSYIEALVDYKAEQRSITKEKSNQKKQEQSSAKEAQEVKGKAVATLNDKGMNQYDDYEEVVLRNDSLVVSDLMVEALTEMEGGELVAYYLGKNPSRSKAIAGMTTYKQSVALRSIERQLSKTTSRKVTKAPAPTRGVKNKGVGVKKDPSKMSTDEWIAYRNKKQFG